MKTNILRALSDNHFQSLIGEVLRRFRSISLIFFDPHVFKQTHSNTAVSGLCFLLQFQQLFLAVFRCLCRRWKKTSLMLTNIFRGLLLLLLIFNLHNLVMIYLISFLLQY